MMLDDFEQFVTELGADGCRYSEDELRQLHVAVYRMAEFLLDVLRMRRQSKARRRSPQATLDAGADDRTIQLGNPLTPSDEVTISSTASP